GGSPRSAVHVELDRHAARLAVVAALAAGEPGRVQHDHAALRADDLALAGGAAAGDAVAVLRRQHRGQGAARVEQLALAAEVLVVRFRIAVVDVVDARPQRAGPRRGLRVFALLAQPGIGLDLPVEIDAAAAARRGEAVGQV